MSKADDLLSGIKSKSGKEDKKEELVLFCVTYSDSDPEMFYLTEKVAKKVAKQSRAILLQVLMDEIECGAVSIYEDEKDKVFKGILVIDHTVKSIRIIRKNSELED